MLREAERLAKNLVFDYCHGVPSQRRSAMHIGLDFDGLIADGARLKSAVLKQRFGIDIPPSHCKRAIALQEGLVSEEVYEKTLRIVYEDPAVHELMPPIPGAIETIHRWLAYGHRVLIITARDPLAERNVLPWLARH